MVQTFPKKKSLEPKGSKDCTLIYLILRGCGIRGRTDYPPANRQVFWLPDHPTFRAFPRSPSGYCGFRPRLQRRDRSRFSRDSLSSFSAPDRYLFDCSPLVASSSKCCQAFSQKARRSSFFRSFAAKAIASLQPFPNAKSNAIHHQQFF